MKTVRCTTEIANRLVSKYYDIGCRTRMGNSSCVRLKERRVKRLGWVSMKFSTRTEDQT